MLICIVNTGMVRHILIDVVRKQVDFPQSNSYYTNHINEDCYMCECFNELQGHFLNKSFITK